MKVLSRLRDDKRRWRLYKRRAAQLPEPYRTATRGLEKYILNTGPGDGTEVLTMVEDLADLMERSAADGIAVRDIVGDDPVDFADDFTRNYGVGSWLQSQHRKLRNAVDSAERLETPRHRADRL
jgi:DNA-binding ferritin-like protein (Dps family)